MGEAVFDIERVNAAVRKNLLVLSRGLGAVFQSQEGFGANIVDFETGRARASAHLVRRGDFKMHNSLRWLVVLQIGESLRNWNPDFIEYCVRGIFADQLLRHLLAARAVSGLSQQNHNAPSRVAILGSAQRLRSMLPSLGKIA